MLTAKRTLKCCHIPRKFQEFPREKREQNRKSCLTSWYELSSFVTIPRTASFRPRFYVLKKSKSFSFDKDMSSRMNNICHTYMAFYCLLFLAIVFIDCSVVASEYCMVRMNIFIGNKYFKHFLERQLEEDPSVFLLPHLGERVPHK